MKQKVAQTQMRTFLGYPTNRGKGTKNFSVLGQSILEQPIPRFITMEVLFYYINQRSQNPLVFSFHFSSNIIALICRNNTPYSKCCVHFVLSNYFSHYRGYPFCPKKTSFSVLRPLPEILWCQST